MSSCLLENSTSTISKDDHIGHELRCQWRRMNEGEEFFEDEYDFHNTVGQRGYIAKTLALLHGHDNCRCYRSNVPDVVYWFMPHNEEDHGKSPLHKWAQPLQIRQLWEQMPSIIGDQCSAVQLVNFPHTALHEEVPCRYGQICRYDDWAQGRIPSIFFRGGFGQGDYEDWWQTFFGR